MSSITHWNFILAGNWLLIHFKFVFGSLPLMAGDKMNDAEIVREDLEWVREM